MSSNNSNSSQEQANLLNLLLLQALSQAQQNSSPNTSQRQSNVSYSDSIPDDQIHNIISQIMRNDSNSYGNPPASQTAIKELHEIAIEPEDKQKLSSCSICADQFEVGTCATQLPCKHWFHSDCLYSWLKLHNTCPLCRFELDTLDEEYESKKREKRWKQAEEQDQQHSNLPEYMYM